MRPHLRELIKVAQRNFRKFISMREWGWFIIIQKTRPLIGRPDPNEELRLLEEKAAATYGVYKEKCDTKVSLFFVHRIGIRIPYVFSYAVQFGRSRQS